MLLSLLLLGLGWAGAFSVNKACDSVAHGFECSPQISHYWGQYSPYFSVASNVSTETPPRCSVTFAQVLSRHGARDPTFSKTKTYNETIQKIQQNTQQYIGSNVTFLEDLVYSLGADELTVFGQRQMYNSGIKFFHRYPALSRKKHLFVRSSGESRVVESARNFTQGFHHALVKDSYSNLTADYPYDIVVISEDDGSNNTLSHDLCTNFENEDDDVVDARGQGPWNEIWLPPITARINAQLPGANLTDKEISYMMDLCPFYTVADVQGKLSQFCGIFFEEEWKQYDYYQSLGKYYHYGAGDPLGPTQGVGFANELIARLIHKPVQDHTSTNETLDSSAATFPIGSDSVLFADFSHDNDMTAIFFALGLYNGTSSLDNTEIEEAPAVGGYSAAWTVPFAARLYVEGLTCGHSQEEYIRFIVNDRVIPLSCADRDGKCKLQSYLDTLTFVKRDGDWSACFS
ncbi:acid phosphatase [Saccharata proteae CBS 121410]|uniref:Phytase A n=1 Tax=Saccharata proteae CBS 121410 TaxID=1314787 RepID=A0A9P4LZZ3_9PEZI|nr:acid phosphatase [Saccharata proteae CBS 121410]